MPTPVVQLDFQLIATARPGQTFNGLVSKSGPDVYDVEGTLHDGLLYVKVDRMGGTPGATDAAILMDAAACSLAHLEQLYPNWEGRPAVEQIITKFVGSAS